MSEIRRIHVGTVDYDIAAKYIMEGSTPGSETLHTWEDITSLVSTSFEIKGPVDTLPTLDATSYETYKNCILLCNNGETPETGTYVEWVAVRTGTSTYTYSWEKIGTSATDLSEYAKKGTYTPRR